MATIKIEFTLLEEVLYALILFVWVIIVVQVISRMIYHVAKERVKSAWKMEDEKLVHHVGIYFARKAIHILAGGVVAFLISMFVLFRSPIIPFTLGMVFAALCYIPHKTERLMYWFQDPDNMYEVNFCITWAFTMSLSWLLSGGNFWPGPYRYYSWLGVTG